jgi:protein-L-isoaspartate(D-aspartate) O-methyltransferase
MEADGTFERARRKLVAGVRAKGIGDEDVLRAIGRVPRHRFVPPEEARSAYIDEALSIACGQTISQPFTVAYQTELLSVAPGDRVLEIGTGSGYQAAVLAEMGVVVYSIERHAHLHEHTRQLLAELGYDIHLKLGDGTRGWPEHAPFDGILVTAAAQSTPPALLDQLSLPKPGKPGGRLVIPLGDSDSQVMTRLIRVSLDHFDREERDSFRFVPLIGES